MWNPIHWYIGKYFCIPLLHTCCQICILWNIILFHKTMEKEAFEGLRMVCFIMNNIKRFKMYVLTEATSWFHILVTISKFKVRKQRLACDSTFLVYLFQEEKSQFNWAIEQLFNEKFNCLCLISTLKTWKICDAQRRRKILWNRL